MKALLFGFTTAYQVMGLLTASQILAQDFSMDENEMFSDSVSVVDSAAAKKLSATSTPTEKKSVGFSGNLLWVGQGQLDHAYFDAPDVKHTGVYNHTVGNVALDVRLLRGYKAFADLEWSYSPMAQGIGADSSSTWRIPEMFFDANFNHRIYFRFGKQILQWGRCYFFNPTDLVNVENKTFLRRIGNREGVYGAKAHIPFGTAWNLYAFLDLQGLGRIDSVAGAFRAERLFGATEMSVMIWDRGHRTPVYGADISTRILHFDIKGEWALHQAFRAYALDIANGVPTLSSERKEWSSQASLSLGRAFRVSGIQDRLNTVAEYFFNGPGNSDHHLGLAPLLKTAGTSSDANSMLLSSLTRSGFYEPNAYSQHYAAFFATFSRFLSNDMTLSMNAITNLNQSSATLSTGLSYQDLNDFGFSFFINGFIGPKDSEYALSGQALQFQLLGEVGF